MTNSKSLNLILIAALALALVAALTGPPPPAGAADRPLKAAHVVKVKDHRMIRYTCGNTYALEPVIPLEEIPFLHD
jgi:hypothetical protein